MLKKSLAPLTSIVGRTSKAISPSLYGYLRRKYVVRQFPKRLRSGPPAILHVPGYHIRMFGMLHVIFGVLHFAESRGHSVEINLEVGPYFDSERGTNWWAYYFEPSRFVFTGQNMDGMDPLKVDAIWRFARYGNTLSINAAHQVMSNLSVKDHIRAKADEFAAQNFVERHVIGVHYRGTDKVDQQDKGRPVEAVRVPYDYVFEYLATYDTSSYFFVATDEAEFVTAMTERFGDRVLAYDAIRSQGGWAIHYEQRDSSPYQAGEDALVDCLLLSKCDHLVRTESALSRFSNIFNPVLRPINLTDRYNRDRK